MVSFTSPRTKLQWLSYAFRRQSAPISAARGQLGSYMKLALELSVSPQLDKDDLVEEQPHEIEGLGDVPGVLTRVGHFAAACDGVFASGAGRCAVEERLGGGREEVSVTSVICDVGKKPAVGWKINCATGIHPLGGVPHTSTNVLDSYAYIGDRIHAAGALSSYLASTGQIEKRIATGYRISNKAMALSRLATPI